MKIRLQNDSHGFGTTHPTPQDRIENILSLIKKQHYKIPTNRINRFKQFKKII